MKLIKARVQNYRSVIDSGEFEVEELKTIMVGPNEAGKSAILQALQHLNRPEGIEDLNALRDYPRSKYSEITKKKVDPKNVEVVRGVFLLSDEDISALPESVRNPKLTYTLTRYMNGRGTHSLDGLPDKIYLKDIKSDLMKLKTHLDDKAPTLDPTEKPIKKPSDRLDAIISDKSDYSLVSGELAKALKGWLENDGYSYIDDEDEKQNSRLQKLIEQIKVNDTNDNALAITGERMPVFVLFNNYFRVRPLIHLRKLAERIESEVLDDNAYDYGNVCLLNLLGLSASELAQMADSGVDRLGNPEELDSFRDKLDERQYALNAASVDLTNEIRAAWNPNEETGEASKLNIRADGQYLKVVVEDDMGVEVELDQRSEGFQWLVSFFVVFFAETSGEHKNAILLLDEPGLHLHGLKQLEFRKTLSKLAEKNQTIYTTHSPFLVGPNELDLVRVVEMENRKKGTEVHSQITSSDPAALLPLQQALGYNMGQSLFAQQRNLVVEGLTDFWYISAVSEMFNANGLKGLNENIAVNPAGSASQVVYYSTMLHSQSLKVAALLDSDLAGDTAAEDQTMSHLLGKSGILRIGDFTSSEVKAPEIEDMLRETLSEIIAANTGNKPSEFITQPKRGVVSIMESVASPISKYHLAKSFIRWTRDHEPKDMTDAERKSWQEMFVAANKVLK